MEIVPRYLANKDAFHYSTEVETELLVIGSGVAALYAAVLAAERNCNVLLVTKAKLHQCNTYHAQGGIAAAVDPNDCPESHYKDTIKAGAGLCDPKAVKFLVEKGPEEILALKGWGMRFDCNEGRLLLAKEGGHSRERVIRAGGDAIGKHLWEFLASKVRDKKNIKIWENAFVVDLLTNNHQCMGALVLDANGVFYRIWAMATVLSSGGAGRIYVCTSNSPVSTGDGYALALRAGARIRDMEFVQFHPTVLAIPESEGILITEALRGEGAVLRNHEGKRFLKHYDQAAELAPRDVVSKAIFNEMARSQKNFVWLDATALGEEYISKRFPNIFRKCLQIGLNMGRDQLPVAPAAHYFMGGIAINLEGTTGINGLFACGEAACTGAHGANRLASNSLLEALVFSRRVVETAEKYLSRLTSFSRRTDKPGRKFYSTGVSLQKQNIFKILREDAQRYIGVTRRGKDLEKFLSQLQGYYGIFQNEARNFSEFETQNCLLVATLITKGALLRKESRGCHNREDYPHVNWDNSKNIYWNRQETGVIKFAIR